MRLPSGEKQALLTESECRIAVGHCCPDAASHKCAAASGTAVAVTIRDPSGLNSAHRTEPVFVNVKSGAPVCPSHTFAVLSADAVTNFFPSELKEIFRIGSVCA